MLEHMNNPPEMQTRTVILGAGGFVSGASQRAMVDSGANVLALAHQSVGTLNIATGNVVSFRDAADMVVSHFDSPVAITGTPRSGPMPLNGYRPFDPAARAH